jgi:hypothetical protein
MGDVVSFSILLDSDLGRQLTVDLARFRENLLDEKTIRKKYRLANDVWEKLADDDELIRKVEEESVRRIRDGSSKREKSQQLIMKAPNILDSIMSGGSDVSPRHKIDAIRTLDGMAANGPTTTPAADRFIISIVLNSDDGSAPHTLHFDKSRTPDPHDIDRANNSEPVPQDEWLPVITANKPKDDDQW